MSTITIDRYDFIKKLAKIALDTFATNPVPLTITSAYAFECGVEFGLTEEEQRTLLFLITGVNRQGG
jgi:hypothetical protein